MLQRFSCISYLFKPPCSKSCHVCGIPRQLYHLSESKGYIAQGYHLTESDVTNALRQWNYVNEFCEVMNRMNKNLAEYFRFICWSKQLINPLPSLNNTRLLLRGKKLNNRNNKHG